MTILRVVQELEIAGSRALNLDSRFDRVEYATR